MFLEWETKFHISIKQGKIIVIYIWIFGFQDRRWED
jgi:hypothetical protein